MARPDLLRSAAILLVLPAVIALIAENTGHVKAVAEMTGHDLDPVMGRAIAADGVGTVHRLLGRRLPDDDLRREHRRHGRHPGLLHRRLLRGRGRRDPLRPLAEVRRPRGLDPRRRARRHHRRPLRHDRPARREDLEGERGRLRQPDQPRPDRGRHHHRHRQRQGGHHRGLLARGHRPRHHRHDRRLPPGPGASPRPSCATGPTAPRSPWATTSTATATASTTSTRRATPAPPASATRTATDAPDPATDHRPARGPRPPGRGGAFPQDPSKRQDRLR